VPSRSVQEVTPKSAVGDKRKSASHDAADVRLHRLR
jgi:hypothetical protein